MKSIVHIHAGSSAYDAANDREIVVTGRHFSDFEVQIREEITDEDCNVIGERVTDAIFTQQEINNLFNRNGRVEFDD